MTSPFKLAVLGAGRWGLNHVRTAAKLFGEDFVAVADLNADREAAVKEVAPQAHFSTDWLEIFKNPDITAVIIATPAETHFELARLALESGKHALVEKPLAMFSGQARELTRLAHQKGLVLMVGHILIYHGAIQKIKAMLSAGDLGKIQYIYSNRLNLGKVRKEENILWSFAPHDVSVLHFLLNEEPDEVSATGGIFLQPGIHDVTLTALKYPHNIQAHIHVSWLHPFKEHRLVVIGDKSMVVFEDNKSTDKLVLYSKGIDWVNGEPVQRNGDFVVVDYPNVMPLNAEQEHFRDCVENGKEPITDGENGYNVLKVLERAQQSLESKAPEGENLPAPEAPAASFYVHPTALVDDGCEIGEGTKIWHYSHVQSGAKIGKKCSLGQNVNVGNNVLIGDNVKIQNNVSVYEGVELADYVFCGPSMVFTNVMNPRCEFPQRGSEFYLKTPVGRGASLGANCTIVCGNSIGKYAFVGAGSVVTKDVPDHAVVVGNPARVVGYMTRDGRRVATLEEAKGE
ncbi:MAG TPA: Gfo/Idh/MocA family oxidoreductase [Calditrichia bacterium]|nr:Gfo/Idh/MocA family oxidoreductase [Calditrichia bacterium]